MRHVLVVALFLVACDAGSLAHPPSPSLDAARDAAADDAAALDAAGSASDAAYANDGGRDSAVSDSGHGDAGDAACDPLHMPTPDEALRESMGVSGCVDTRLNGAGCLYATTAHDVSHADYSTGFRCCADLP